MSTQITIASRLPYKVYTALLTQNGGDNPIVVSGDGGQIVLGVTYYINANPGQDLIIYGAPNNNVGTYFIANQTTYLPYGDTLELTANTGAPVVTVLENTIGNIWFTYSGVGIYSVNSNSLFIENKTYLPLANIDISLISGVERFLFNGWNSESILTLNNNDASFNSTNDIGRGYLEIRVYN